MNSLFVLLDSGGRVQIRATKAGEWRLSYSDKGRHHTFVTRDQRVAKYMENMEEQDRKETVKA